MFLVNSCLSIKFAMTSEKELLIVAHEQLK